MAVAIAKGGTKWKWFHSLKYTSDFLVSSKCHHITYVVHYYRPVPYGTIGTWALHREKGAIWDVASEVVQDVLWYF